MNKKSGRGEILLSIFSLKELEMMNTRSQIIFILTITLALMSASCADQISKLNQADEPVIFPGPPDTARIQYLTSISTSSQITGKKSGFSNFVLGESTEMGIIKPYGIAVHGRKIYICDTGLGGIVIIDLENETFDHFVPKGEGQFKLPLNCSIDDNGRLYVADGERKQVVVFDNEGNYVHAFGEKGEFKPTDVFVRGDKIFVSDSKGHKVIIYSMDSFEKLSSFPEKESGEEGYVYTPTNIFVSENAVYVSDIGDSKIKKYSFEGELLSSIGSYGNYVGQFVRLKGIALDKDENLYAVDAGFENVQVFDRDGNLLMFFGGPYEGPGYMWLPAKVAVDYGNLDYFQKYADSKFDLSYLIFVTNQYGPDKIGVYGFIKPKAKSI